MANIKEIDHHQADSFIIWRVITFDFAHFEIDALRSSPHKITRLHCVFLALTEDSIQCFSYCHPSLLSHWFWENNEIDGIESDGWMDRWIEHVMLSYAKTSNDPILKSTIL